MSEQKKKKSKHANELKVHEKNVRTAIKQDLKIKSFARTPRDFLSTKMMHEIQKNKTFVRKIFLYFGLQIYGLHQA